MNEVTKQKIISLRSAGETYTAIAEALDISINTVKSFCRRNPVAPKPLITEPAVTPCACRQCHAPLIQLVGHKEKKFCSDACRMKWWKAHPEQLKKKAVYRFTCPGCMESFTSYGNKGRKYCSHDCYIRHRFGGDIHE